MKPLQQRWCSIGLRVFFESSASSASVPMDIGSENSQETCRAILRIATAGHGADVLNNDIWTRKAQDLCRTVRFDVSRSCASHVEKQLIAYYIYRPWLFDEDDCLSTSMELSQHTSLRAVLPSPRPAIITVNKLRICSDCLVFYDQFCNYFMKH